MFLVLAFVSENACSGYLVFSLGMYRILGTVYLREIGYVALMD